MLEYQRVELLVYVTQFTLAVSLQLDLNNPKWHCRILEYQMCLVNQQDDPIKRQLFPLVIYISICRLPCRRGAIDSVPARRATVAIDNIVRLV